MQQTKHRLQETSHERQGSKENTQKTTIRRNIYAKRKIQNIYDCRHIETGANYN